MIVSAGGYYAVGVFPINRVRHVSTSFAVSQVCSQRVLKSIKAVPCHQLCLGFSMTEYQSAAKEDAVSRLMTSAMHKPLGN